MAFGLLVAAAVLAAATASPPEPELRLLPSPGGALCLDGSAPGYYLRKADESRLLFHFLGGGWCYSVSDCANRATTNIGSSKTWPQYLNQTSFYYGGIMDATRSDNAFANFTLIYVAYCDGSSYTGNRSEPVQYGNQTLYFRGRRILDAVLQDVQTTQGLSGAKEVVVSGSSAGGLTVYLHVDYITQKFSPARVVGMIDAGYFLDANNTKGVLSYGDSCRSGMQAWGVDSTSFDATCVARTPASQLESCFFAPNFITDISTPIFMTNSLVDAWQMGNVLQVGCSPGVDSTGGCTADQLNAISQWGSITMMQALAPAMKLLGPKLGYFFDKCPIHTETCGDSWYDYRAGPNYNDSMATAFTRWYYQGGSVGVMDPSGWSWQADYNPSCRASSGGWC